MTNLDELVVSVDVDVDELIAATRDAEVALADLNASLERMRAAGFEIEPVVSDLDCDCGCDGESIDYEDY